MDNPQAKDCKKPDKELRIESASIRAELVLFIMHTLSSLLLLSSASSAWGYGWVAGQAGVDSSLLRQARYANQKRQTTCPCTLSMDHEIALRHALTWYSQLRPQGRCTLLRQVPLHWGEERCTRLAKGWYQSMSTVFPCLRHSG
jgi:hypothetical protein